MKKGSIVNSENSVNVAAYGVCVCVEGHECKWLFVSVKGSLTEEGSNESDEQSERIRGTQCVRTEALR